jgi:two-component system sensor histidine kinase/response regulator
VTGIMVQARERNAGLDKNTGKKSQSGIIYLLIFVFLAAIIITAGFFFYRNYESHFRSETERNLTTIVELKVSELATWRREKLNDALFFFRNSVFSELVKRYSKQPADREAQNQIRAWLSHFQVARHYERILLLDDCFIKKMIIPEREERLVSYVSLNSLAVLHSGKVVFEDFYWNEENQKIYLQILIPILERRDGNGPLAIVVLRIDPDTYLYPFIERWPTPSRTAETLLIRREGNDALYLNNLKFYKNSALKLHVSLNRENIPAVMAVLGREGIVEGSDYRGEPVIAVLRSVPGSPWFLEARIDPAEVFAPLAERLRIIIILILLLLLGTGAGLSLLRRRQQVYFFKEQMEMAQELLDSQANLRAITASAQDAILMMDDRGRLTYWNHAAERIFGHASAEALGRNLHDLIAPQRYHEAYHAAFPVFLRSGQGAAIGQTLELQGLRKDGVEISVALSLSAVQIKGSWHAVGILRDITKQKIAENELYNLLNELEQANNQLEAANQRANQLAVEAQAANIAKSQFLANMSHEIRTPMNGVIGMIELLTRTDLSPEQRRYAETVRLSGEALLNLINDILDFSKIEADMLELEVLDFNLRVTVEDAAELLAMRAHEKNLEFISRVDPEVCTFLKGDPGRLRQILINLGSNAIKFTARGEVIIEVRLESEDAERIKIRVEVRDTGIGIPADKIGLLFSAFQQVDASTTRRFGGTGLGLAISKRLVEAMGGEIGSESVEGRGSTFWFTADFGKQPRCDRGIGIGLAKIHGVRVLAVDDNATNRLVLSEQLASWGARHAEAESASQALDMLRTARTQGDPFRIAILDMQMPETDGESLGKSIKADPELGDTILVMMTSMGRRGDAKRLEAIGFAAYLTKPVKQSQLYDCLATVIGAAVTGAGAPEVALVTRHTISEVRRLKARILLVEDNLTNQQVALGILEKLGFRADAVGNGREAIKALETAAYDLVFMDVQMPVMDGFEATGAIRSRQTAVPDPKIPIIAMTAHAVKGDRERCIEAGMDDYIPKPITPKAMAAALDKWLGQVKKQPTAVPEPAAGPTPAAPVGPLVFDRQSFIGRLMGDLDLVREITAAFLEDIPEQIQKLKLYIGQGDVRAAEGQAHSIKGAAANVGGLAFSAAALAIETSARANSMKKVAGLLPELEQQFRFLRERLLENEG